jgi:hypothetical protein
MLDPPRSTGCAALAHETLASSAPRSARRPASTPAQVYEIALAGNATMTQLALGIDPEPLGVAPFIMAARSYPEPARRRPRRHVHPRAPAVVFPALGAYVGGDIVAACSRRAWTRDKRLRLFIDVGTNCEIVLGNVERARCRPRARRAGVRGGLDPCGMRAADGAIEVVKIDDGHDARGDRRRRGQGLCGSGLVDAVAELVRVGLHRPVRPLRPDDDAASSRPVLAPRLVETDGGRADLRARLAGGPSRDRSDVVFLSQRDVRELQFAKAADRDRLAAAARGARASRPEPTSRRCCWPARSARTSRRRAPSGSASCPKLPVLRIVSAGNVAGEGAKMAAALGCPSAPARPRCSRRWSTSSSPTARLQRPVRRQLAFPRTQPSA